MITRRDYLKFSLAAAGALALGPRRLGIAADPGLPLISRAIPGTSERLPVVGLGSSASFGRAAGSGDVASLGAVLEAFAAHGGRVFGTAPGYGASEEVAGKLAHGLGLTDKLFWATKLNAAPPGGTADITAARAQLETSFRRIGKQALDLVQVHNMGDPATQLALLREYKQDGRIRYLGITTTFENQYAALEQVMRTQHLDFIGVDYAIDNRRMEERIFPLARDKGIGVLVYAPFGRTRLWQTVREHSVPAWAGEFDADTWARFLLKFVVSNPVVTATTPATSSATHVLDNLGGARGRLPDAAMRKRMIAYIAGL